MVWKMVSACSYRVQRIWFSYLQLHCWLWVVRLPHVDDNSSCPRRIWGFDEFHLPLIVNQRNCPQSNQKLSALPQGMSKAVTYWQTSDTHQHSIICTFLDIEANALLTANANQ